MRWIVILASYAAAAVNYAVTHPPWREAPELAMAMNRVAGTVGTGSFLLWCGLVAFAVHRFRWGAWPVLVGAPLALATAFGIAAILVACVFLGACI